MSYNALPDDVMNTIVLVLSYSAKRYPYCKGENLKIFKNGSTGDSQYFLRLPCDSTQYFL